MTRILICIFLLVMVGCKSTGVTKGEAYPNLYLEKPQSILVVPVINRTTAADAPDLYATTIVQPLAEAGYYVFSIPFINEYFGQEGIVDGQQLEGVAPQRFNTLFGADSVLFVTIDEWDTNYYIAGGNVTVAVKFELVSAHSGEILWQFQDAIVKNTTGDSDNLLIGMIATAINTAVVDYVPIARQVNRQVLVNLPVGKYHELHNKDQQQIVNKVRTGNSYKIRIQP